MKYLPAIIMMGMGLTGVHYGISIADIVVFVGILLAIGASISDL